MSLMEENEIYAVVGEVMMLSARIEGSLESCIAACLPPADPIASKPVLRRLNFTSQVAILHELTQGLFDRRDTQLVEFRRWLGRLKRIRERRNDLVHEVLKVAQSRDKLGRWTSEIARMREEEAAPATPVVDRYHLCFALGKAFEDRGDYAASWRYYSQGNALKRSESRYRPEIIEINARKQAAVCTREFFTSRGGVGTAQPDPIFIVGLPRAGSTLIEQILASHSQVEGTHELGEIPRMVLDLQGRDLDLDNPRYPGVLAELAPEDFLKLGEKYLSDTRIYRSGKPYFIDKMPNNFRHIGLIHLMLPNAKIIDARREPLACCFSNVKQLFATGQEFTYSVEDIARYYRSYLELMQHWDEVLPGRVLRVHHEDVVDDLESNVRRILDFCGLPFEASCLEFYKTARSVRTASSEQVRQPIFRDGLDQWTKYEPWLDTLKDALGNARQRYR